MQDYDSMTFTYTFSMHHKAVLYQKGINLRATAQDS